MEFNHIAYEDTLLTKFRVLEPIIWEPKKAPHIIVVGGTGSGKTYFSKALLGRVVLQDEKSKFYICDYKSDDDFSFLSGCKRFFRYTEVSEGLDAFYEEFSKRQSGEEKSRDMRILFFDEWASYLNSLDKHSSESAKNQLSQLLMMGRSFGIHVIISQQRADAQYFSTARDNFGLVVGLGNLSEESKNMLFHDFKNQMEPDCIPRKGYILVCGTLKGIQVPLISNIEKLNATIKQAVI